MAFTHRNTLTWGSGGEMIGDDVNTTGDTEQNISVTLADNSANTAIDLQFAADTLKAITISVDNDCTLYINDVSGGSPTDTIALKSGIPFVWLALSGVPYPFTGTAGAVTAGYVTVPNSTPDAAVQFELRTLVDLS